MLHHHTFYKRPRLWAFRRHQSFSGCVVRHILVCSLMFCYVFCSFWWIVCCYYCNDLPHDSTVDNSLPPDRRLCISWNCTTDNVLNGRYAVCCWWWRLSTAASTMKIGWFWAIFSSEFTCGRAWLGVRARELALASLQQFSSSLELCALARHRLYPSIRIHTHNTHAYISWWPQASHFITNLAVHHENAWLSFILLRIFHFVPHRTAPQLPLHIIFYSFHSFWQNRYPWSSEAASPPHWGGKGGEGRDMATATISLAIWLWQIWSGKS